jgi:DNA helicase-2/ATP-dependent DNA helicase PcrA
VGRVGAAFYYVREGRTVRPARLPGADRLATLVAGLPAVPDG